MLRFGMSGITRHEFFASTKRLQSILDESWYPVVKAHHASENCCSIADEGLSKARVSTRGAEMLEDQLQVSGRLPV